MEATASTASLDDSALQALIDKGTIDGEQAKKIGFANALYGLVDQNEPVATAVQQSTWTALGGQSAASVRDLARLRPADWAGFFKGKNELLPDGTTPEHLGRVFARRFAIVEPSIALFSRLPTATSSELRTVLSRPQLPIRGEREVPRLIGDPPLPEENAQTSADTSLQRLSRAYPGLKLEEVIHSDALTDDKVSVLQRRVDLVQAVGARLGSADLLDFNLGMESADLSRLKLESDSATAEEQTMVLSTLRAYQRVLVVSRDVDTMHALLDAGYTSAHAIAKEPIELFLEKSSLPPRVTGLLWKTARASMADGALTASAIGDLTSKSYGGTPYDNHPPSITEFLARLPGYAQLFGNQAYCECKECRSILGPAAYFVDLMRYIDDHLRSQFGGQADHPLDLKVRRPDLWTLRLSCENTNERVPTLDIVNEVLENYIAQLASTTFDQAFVSDRPKNTPAILDIVYRNTLAQVEDSFLQPFHLPLARIASYLLALGSSRAAVAEAANAAIEVRAQAELGLSASEFSLITEPETSFYKVADFYGPHGDEEETPGFPFRQHTNPPLIDVVDAAALGAAMKISRADLGLTIETQFVQVAGLVAILDGKRGKDSIQNDIEWVSGLTVEALDRLHRLTRLARKLPWTPTDLDSVLTALQNAVLNAQAVFDVAELHALQRRFRLSVPELCALVGSIPRTPSKKSLFDQLFNSPAFVALNGPFPQPEVSFTHPSFQHGPAVPNQALPRLMVGLGVNLAELEVLIRGLAAHLTQGKSIDRAPNPADPTARPFLLSAENLTLLYRHALAARALGVSIPDLFRLMGLLGGRFYLGSDSPTATLKNLLSLVDLWTWWRNSEYSLDDLRCGDLSQTSRPDCVPRRQRGRCEGVGRCSGVAFVSVDNVLRDSGGHRAGIARPAPVSRRSRSADRRAVGHRWKLEDCPRIDLER
ncbi:MAG: Tc toxin subunit A [Myxococcales bacterium]